MHTYERQEDIGRGARSRPLTGGHTHEVLVGGVHMVTFTKDVSLVLHTEVVTEEKNIFMLSELHNCVAGKIYHLSLRVKPR